MLRATGPRIAPGPVGAGSRAPTMAATIDAPEGPAPLSHHDIMALVAPFSAAGWRIDLAGSRRAERQLRFTRSGAGVAHEVLLLDNADPERFELTRELHGISAAGPAAAAAPGPAADAAAGHPETLVAQVQARAADAAVALQWVDGVPANRCFAEAGGVRIAYGLRVEVAEPGAPPRVRLTRATARPGGFALVLQLPLAGRMPGELALHAPPGRPAQLPQDLLAVRGWAWSRIEPWRGGWRGALRLATREPARSEAARALFEQTVAHLAETLAAPPATFGTRWQRARWRVTLRRAVPALTCLALFGAAAAVPLLELGPDSVFRMLIFNAPPLLMVFMFALREMPRIEIPPLPRPLTQAAWLQEGGA